MFDVFNPYFPDSFKFPQEHLASEQNNTGTLSQKKKKKKNTGTFTFEIQGTNPYVMI